jgi:hypothetical protein
MRGWGGQREGAGGDKGWGEGGEMTQTLYAHMNKKNYCCMLLVWGNLLDSSSNQKNAHLSFKVIFV